MKKTGKEQYVPAWKEIPMHSDLKSVKASLEMVDGIIKAVTVNDRDVSKITVNVMR